MHKNICLVQDRRPPFLLDCFSKVRIHYTTILSAICWVDSVSAFVHCIHSWETQISLDLL